VIKGNPFFPFCPFHPLGEDVIKENPFFPFCPFHPLGEDVIKENPFFPFCPFSPISPHFTLNEKLLLILFFRLAIIRNHKNKKLTSKI